MTSVKTGIAHLVRDVLVAQPGLTDRELTDRILGGSAHPSQVNQACRLMEAKGLLIRTPRADGRIGNYPDGAAPNVAMSPGSQIPAPQLGPDLSEDEVKRHLAHWLKAAGWTVTVAWGRAHGTDIVARRDLAAWIIEAKGTGSLQPMRVNYFIAILGETLQRMNDANAKYSIALPDIPQFRGLWRRLPELAKQRTGITILFVSPIGQVDEVT